MPPKIARLHAVGQIVQYRLRRRAVGQIVHYHLRLQRFAGLELTGHCPQKCAQTLGQILLFGAGCSPFSVSSTYPASLARGRFSMV